jgi:hypothetical protein
VLALRRDRTATVRQFLADLTDEQLEAYTEPVPEPGHPPPDSYPVRDCLQIVLSEEWHTPRFEESARTSL